MSSPKVKILQALKTHLYLPHCYVLFVEDHKLESPDIDQRSGINVSEFKCSQDFDWSIKDVRQTFLSQESNLQDDNGHDFDRAMARGSLQGNGYYLLNLRGTVISRRAMLPGKDVPDIFQQELRGLSHPYTLVEIAIVTDDGLSVKVYGNGMMLRPLVPGVCYQLTYLEITVTPPYIAWIGNLTCAAVINTEKCDTGIHGMESFERCLMRDMIGKSSHGSRILIKARILKLIKLELYVDQSKMSDESSYVSAKLVMSMDDSSCGFLGVCNDSIVAYILGINKAAWLEISGLVRWKGGISIGMGTEEVESGVEKLLRRCFSRSSLQNNREMLVMLMGDSNQRLCVPGADSGNECILLHNI